MWKFIILALLLVVPLSSCGDFENGSAQQGTIDINNVEVIDMQSLLNEAAEAAKFSVFMNSNIVMKTSSDDANVLIQNSEENGADCKVYLFIRLTAYPYLRNGTKPYVVVMAESGPINMTDVDITYEHRGPEIKWNSGSKEEDSWLHEINIDLPDLSEYGTILDAYIPMEDGQYHSQSSSCGLNVHIEAGDEHFHQEYGRSEINSKMIYWCSRCEN